MSKTGQTYVHYIKSTQYAQICLEKPMFPTISRRNIAIAEIPEAEPLSPSRCSPKWFEDCVICRWSHRQNITPRLSASRGDRGRDNGPRLVAASMPYSLKVRCLLNFQHRLRQQVGIENSGNSEIGCHPHPETE